MPKQFGLLESRPQYPGGDLVGVFNQGGHRGIRIGQPTHEIFCSA